MVLVGEQLELAGKLLLGIGIYLSMTEQLALAEVLEALVGGVLGVLEQHVRPGQGDTGPERSLSGVDDHCLQHNNCVHQEASEGRPLQSFPFSSALQVSGFLLSNSSSLGSDGKRELFYSS